MKALELYVHIPFCVQKCRYCDFLSGPAHESTKEQYMEALCREIATRREEYINYTVVSVFIGGGTPSCVDPKWISRVMALIKEGYQLAEDAEISIEVNPGTVDREALTEYYKAGINRLSIGLQSTHKEELAVLGRIHSYEQFEEAYFTAREIGFSNINVDLMSGLPGQTPEKYLESLRKITALKPAPEHISAYSLIIEEGTPFCQEYEQGRLLLPEEDAERAMYEQTGLFLLEEGYERYEISNYARPGYTCRHNIGYWIRENYVGFGIGAASLVENMRFKNTEDIQAYMLDPCNCREDIQLLSETEQMEETMFLGLRLTKGVSCRSFFKSFAVMPEEVYGDVIARHVNQGLLKIYTPPGPTSFYDLQTEADAEGLAVEEDRYICLTSKGMDVSNYVMADFLEP